MTKEEVEILAIESYRQALIDTKKIIDESLDKSIGICDQLVKKFEVPK